MVLIIINFLKVYYIPLTELFFMNSVLFKYEKNELSLIILRITEDEVLLNFLKLLEKTNLLTNVDKDPYVNHNISFQKRNKM